LDVKEQLVLKLFYTAAVFLQQVHQESLYRYSNSWQTLPDLFSKELGLPTSGNPHEQLRQLGERHRELSGLAINWLGTYHHAAQRLTTRLERESSWQT
jgi:hypothetical protein